MIDETLSLSLSLTFHIRKKRKKKVGTKRNEAGSIFLEIRYTHDARRSRGVKALNELILLFAESKLNRPLN